MDRTREFGENGKRGGNSSRERQNESVEQVEQTTLHDNNSGHLADIRLTTFSSASLLLILVLIYKFCVRCPSKFQNQTLVSVSQQV